MNCQNARILIVDDDHTTLEMLVRFLKMDGYQVSFATSIASMLSVLEKKHRRAKLPELIVLDLMLGGNESGFRAAETLKADPLYKGIPRLALSAMLHETKHILTAYESGFSDYIPKPFESNLLRAKVCAWVDMVRTIKGT